MKKLLLHIGMHKTGTSSIQQTLRGYDDGKTTFLRHPSHAAGNHSFLIQHMFDDHQQHFQKMGWEQRKIIATKVKWLSQLHNYIDNLKHDRLIISGEGIRNMKPIAKKNLVEFFQAKSFDVEIFCIVRNPVDWALSASQQNLKSSAKRVNIVPGYKRSLATFSELISEDKIRVHDFNELLDGYGDIVVAFSDLLGLNLSGYKIKRSNESLSFLAAKILHNMNKRGFNSVGTEHLFKKRLRLIEYLTVAFKNSPKPWPKEEIKPFLLSPETKQDVDYLRSNFKINYNYNSENQKNSLEPNEFFDKFLCDFDDQELKLISSTLKKYEVKVASLNIDEICKALNDSLAGGSLQDFSAD